MLIDEITIGEAYVFRGDRCVALGIEKAPDSAYSSRMVRKVRLRFDDGSERLILAKEIPDRWEPWKAKHDAAQARLDAEAALVDRVQRAFDARGIDLSGDPERKWRNPIRTEGDGEVTVRFTAEQIERLLDLIRQT